VRDSKPLLIRNAASHWIGVKRCTPEYLAREYGDRDVTVAPVLEAKGWCNAWVESSRLWKKKRAMESKDRRSEAGPKREQIRVPDTEDDEDEEDEILMSMPLTLCTLSRRKTMKMRDFVRHVVGTVNQEGDSKLGTRSSEKSDQNGLKNGRVGYYIDGGRNLGGPWRPAAPKSSTLKPSSHEKKIKQPGTSGVNPNEDLPLPMERASLSFLRPELGIPRIPEDFLIDSHESLWIGGKAVTSMHFDSFENLYTVVRGSKVMTLISPKDSSRVVKLAMRKGAAGWDEETSQIQRLSLLKCPVYNYSSFNWNDSTERRLKNFKVAILRCEVSCGDTLFIPSHWWHRVESVPDKSGLCMAVSRFYEPTWGYFSMERLRSRQRDGQQKSSSNTDRLSDLCLRNGMKRVPNPKYGSGFLRGSPT